MSQEGRDRRRAPRVEVDAPARIYLTLGFHQARCKNASLAGLGLEVFSPLPAGTSFTVWLEMNGERLAFAAELVRGGVYPDGIAGVRFTDVDDTVLRRLFAWVRVHSVEPAPHHGFFADEWAVVPTRRRH
jgi:hypothetical protein